MHDIRLHGAPVIPVRQHEGGYAAEGPGFYIWDEDREQVLQAARELAGGARRVAASTRFLVIPPAPGAEGAS